MVEKSIIENIFRSINNCTMKIKMKQESIYARSIIEANLDPLIVINAKGRITDMNQAFIRLTDVKRSSIIDSDFSNYFSEPKKACEVYNEIFSKGLVKNVPMTITDGRTTNVLLNGAVYSDADGVIQGAIIVASDLADQKGAIELRLVNKELAFQNIEKEKRAAELIIINKELAFQNDEKERRAAELFIANKELLFQTSETEKRAADLLIADIKLEFNKREKEEQKNANKELEKVSASLKLASQYSLSLIEASRDPLFTISAEGIITDVNQASVKVTGASREELIGANFSDYFTEPEKARQSYKLVFANNFVVDYPLIVIDGKLTNVLFNGSVYRDEKDIVVGAVMVARDITELKKSEKELIEAKVFAELALEIAERAKIKAEEAARVAENAARSKQQFLSNMSHEIRTPMNAIIGFTKVVLKTELTEKQKEYLTAIKLSGDALIVLINDILDLAKVDAGKMSFEQIPFKMATSISAMLHLFDTKIKEKNLELIKEYDNKIPETLIGDPVRLHQIILNLIGNAVKFTTNGKITFGIELLTEDDERAVIKFSIKDTGIGIAENKISEIFENFQQASSNTSRLYGGTGLGLAIVKQLVESQGGSIFVDSKVDEGSTFSFILNFQKTNIEAISVLEISDIDTENRNIKVLVVEDISLNQLLMKTLLDDFNFECDIAANGRIAIEKLQINQFDIILMDLQMPEMNGFEATDHIRNKMKSDIPIIALTADVTTVDLDKCRAVGMNDYIAKPVDDKLLFNKIVSLVKNQPVVKSDVVSENANIELKKPVYINLKYLSQRTKSNPELYEEMISLYLKQSPVLIQAMKQSLMSKDWSSLRSAAHKMIPSFSIVGINKEFEIMAVKLQDYTGEQPGTVDVEDLVFKLESVCSKACLELEAELARLKNNGL